MILAWRAPCGQCRFCRIGQPHLCAASLNAEPRQHTPDGDVIPTIMGLGTFATHTVVAALQAVPIPREVPPEQACLIGCGVMTGVGAALYTAAGPAGQHRGRLRLGRGRHQRDPGRPPRRRRARSSPSTWSRASWSGRSSSARPTPSTPARATRSQQIKELTGGHGVDYAFEAVGHPKVLPRRCARRDLAGVCTLIGVPERRRRHRVPGCRTSSGWAARCG